MTRTHQRFGFFVMGLLLIAATAVGCGESDAEQAQNQVCETLADLNTQVNELATFTAATATTKDVQQQLDAIKTDLSDIKDAQGDLNEDRKQQVESANKEFSSQVQAVASDLGTSLSASGAEAKLQSAAAAAEKLLPADLREGRLQFIAGPARREERILPRVGRRAIADGSASHTKARPRAHLLCD